MTTARYPFWPLTVGVILPHMKGPLEINSPEAAKAVKAASESTERLLLVVPMSESGYSKMGTVVRLEEQGTAENGRHAAVVEGRVRGELGKVETDPDGTLYVQVTLHPDSPAITPNARELMQEYRALLENLLEARGAQAFIHFLRGVDHPGHLADLCGWSPDLSIARKIQILEELDVEKRLSLLIEWMKQTIAEQSLKEKIRTNVDEAMSKTQREFILRQQMEAIRKELGEAGADVVSEYRKRITDAALPEKARKEAEKELSRLERMPEQNPEHSWIRNYLDWLLDIPWGKITDDNFDLKHTREILDADHSGLEDVKDRVIEFLAVRKRKSHQIEKIDKTARGDGAILCLVGPPGVGKTSLGESIARAMGRNFARVSLGGIHDEAEIRGHRRTYVGALPGRLARALKESGSMNPVILLDEVDKLGHDFRGDPTSALLEVLDPAQNHTFRDHYLDIDLDLSQVLFIPTANVAEQIPSPLLDRMEVIRMDGYTEDEKLTIARAHLWPRQLARAGFTAEEVNIEEAAISFVISEYTREAGVRNLERELGAILRKVATEVESDKATLPIVIRRETIAGYLKRPRFYSEIAARTAVPGVATGLAVTGSGGDVLFIEATLIPDSEAGLMLTGQLGDVMKESAQIALSAVRSHQKTLGIPILPRGTVHIHVPAGAVPKDGPSAGIAIASALASLASGRPVRADVGMTGELTLQGKVLPIGGVKQKVLAALRAGLKTVILPRRNERDLEDLPKAARDALQFHFVEDLHEVLDIALEPQAIAV